MSFDQLPWEIIFIIKQIAPSICLVNRKFLTDLDHALANHCGNFRWIRHSSLLRRHNPNGPWSVSSIMHSWSLYNRHHRMDGPALDLRGVKSRTYHIAGYRLTSKQFAVATKNSDVISEVKTFEMTGKITPELTTLLIQISFQY